jgi:hypothetical protein
MFDQKRFVARRWQRDFQPPDSVLFCDELLPEPLIARRFACVVAISQIGEVVI